MKVGIIGAGIVGGAIEHWFAEAHELFIRDPLRGTTLSDVTDNVDMAYIAVPTPMAEDGSIQFINCRICFGRIARWIYCSNQKHRSSEQLSVITRNILI